MPFENVAKTVKHEQTVISFYITGFDNNQKHVTSIIYSIIGIGQRDTYQIVYTDIPTS